MITRNTLATANTAKLIIISFIDLLAVGLTFPLLYPHLKSLGASHVTIGIFGSTYSGIQVLSGPVIGSWSDIRGRKFVATITLVVAAFCYVLIGLTSSIIIILLLRIILGLVKHTQTLCKAITGDLVPAEKHVEIFGWSSAIGSLGFVIGPLVAGHLSELPNGFSYVCCLTAVLFIINIGLVQSLPESNNNRSQNGTELFSLSHIKVELLKAVTDLGKVDWTIYWAPFLVRFLFALTVTIFFTNGPFYVQEKFGASQKFIGYTISFISTIGSVTGFTLGIITRKFYSTDLNCSRRLFHGFLLLCFSFLGLRYAPTFGIYFVFLIPFGISNSILRIVSMEAILVNSKDTDRGSLSGALNSVMSVARFISPISTGIISDIFGDQFIMFSAFIISLIGTIFCWKLRYKFIVIRKRD